MFNRGCTDSSESTLVKMPLCWKSHVTAHMYFFAYISIRQKCKSKQPFRELAHSSCILNILTLGPQATH